MRCSDPHRSAARVKEAFGGQPAVFLEERRHVRRRFRIFLPQRRHGGVACLSREVEKPIEMATYPKPAAPIHCAHVAFSDRRRSETVSTRRHQISGTGSRSA